MLSPVDPHVVMGFYFSPRGGSAQVARYLCRALGSGPWAPTLFAGSAGLSADPDHVDPFFAGLSCHGLDYSGARAAWELGADPMSVDVPMHASFEDKAGVPDRIFFALDDLSYRRQVRSWMRFFASHTTQRPSVVHLHHLTPMHEAVRLLWPGIPVVTHLHGTELKMLELAGNVAPSSRWAPQWVERIERWARESDRVVVVSAADGDAAVRLLPIDAARITTVSNGVDTEVFASATAPSAANRRVAWKRWLIDDPHGWRPGEGVGSIRYTDDDLTAFTDHTGNPTPVVLFAGRFMAFKRVQLLIESHHAMRRAGGARSVLVIAGGFPGEWEGEHPYDTVQRIGAEDVFFVGWREHDVLAQMLRCSDVFAAPSVDEPFGLVYLEAMAAGVPPIASASGGPLSFINIDPDLPTGWLVAPDDERALTAALASAVADPAERRARGIRAARFARDEYSWDRSAERFAEIYRDVIDERAAAPRRAV